MATIKRLRPDLLTTVETRSEPIPEQAPPHFFEKQTDTVEGVGAPTTACFLTKAQYDPTNWYILLLLVFLLAFLSHCYLLGGYLRNMTACARSGIRLRKYFIRDMERSFRFPRTLSSLCRKTYFWMANYGKIRLPEITTVTYYFFHSSNNRFGRENFQESMKISYRTDASLIDWANFKYMVFDLPTLREDYEKRYTTLGKR